MKRFVRSKSGLITYIALIWAVINMVVYTSEEALDSVDMLYLNGLFLVITAVFLCFEYRRFNSGVGLLYKQAQNGQQIQAHMMGEDYDSKEMKAVIASLIREHEGQLSKYNDSIDEIDAYLNKWIHEVKIPISVITMMAEHLSDNERAELLYELERIKYYVHQALYISKANDYNHDLFFEEVDVDQFLKDVIKQYKHFFMQKDLTVLMEGDSGLMIYADKQWFSYIIGQILHNSTKYSKQSGVVTIKRCGQKGRVQLGIVDNGIGIDPKEINRIFDKGFVGSNGRQHKKATGMGLYLSKKMASILGWQLIADSKPKEYCAFYLTIPDINVDYNLQKK